ncbi:Uncharacterised protein [Yersinia frederiksenii]|nr:Uncharacterised protein [Yersinia frederiksenii]
MEVLFLNGKRNIQLCIQPQDLAQGGGFAKEFFLCRYRAKPASAALIADTGVQCRLRDKVTML